MYICVIFINDAMKKRNLLLQLFCFISIGALADPVSLTQALKIASAYMSEAPSVDNLAPIRRMGVRVSTAADTLAPYYVINRGDNAGFVIVSGDDCLPEIIGYADSGEFVEEQMPPALLDMLEGYAELIAKAQAANASPRTPRKAPAGRVDVAPIIKTHWHQSSPYNDLAPFITNTTNRAATGCTCTAAVMVLHHYRRDLPGELLASTPTYGYGDAPVTVSYPKGTPILWDLMQNNYNGNYPEEMRNAVAVLNAAFGAGIWQTYGSSTSGQISNIVDGYNQYFNLSSVCQYKGGTNQSSWESMVYGNLIKGQPMVYAGVHPSNGGHAIILDGYNAKDGLFHFNFGWGGQGDGYYTLDDETGVNGFSGQQGMVYNIAPKKPNISAKIHTEAQAYRRMETTIRVSATNHGTLDYSGFNLYWSTSNRVPSSSTSVSESNSSLSLASDESGEFSVTFKPTAGRTYYIYLTDKNYNVLDKAEIAVLPVNPDLTLKSFDITAGEAVESHESGTYRLLYNDKLQAFAEIENSKEGTPVQTTLRMELMKHNEGANAMETIKTITIPTQKYEPGSVIRVTTDIADLEVGGRYALCIKNKLTNVTDDDALNMGSTDSILYFKVCPPTLECLSVDGTIMRLSGAWDALLFSTLAVDPEVTVYDLTQVSGISGQPIAANPNALFLVGKEMNGYNIVYDGICEELRLQPNFNFTPIDEFIARRATFIPKWDISQGWQPFALTFTAVRPLGYLCQRVTSISSSAIAQQEFVDTLSAYTPYMVMTCDNSPITANDVVISGDVSDIDTIPSFHAVISTSFADENTLVFSYDKEESSQYFTRVEVGTKIEPFTAIIKSTSKRVRSHRNSSAQNESYMALALAIDEANHTYDALHSQIEAEWNEVLLDSIRYAYDVFSSMPEETDEMQAYASRLVDLLNTYRLKQAHVAEPICYNSLLVNPSFELKTKEGWTSGSNTQLVYSGNLNNFGVGMDGSCLLYGNAGDSDISQTVSGLSPGYYRLTVMAGAGVDGAVSLFAGERTLGIKAHPWGKYYLTEYVIDSIKVEEDFLLIGVKGGESWYKVDNFSLHFLGRLDDNNIDSDIERPLLQQAPPLRTEVVYDLFGRRIGGAEEMVPGNIYIVNGHKVICEKE